MARGAGNRKELLERQFRGYMAKHRRTDGEGEEAYEFNIKMYVDIPDIVRRVLSEDAIDDLVQSKQADRLAYFAEEMKATYPWISIWGQVGRSGGWLYFSTNDAVLDHNGEIKPPEPNEQGPHDWSPSPLAAAATRLKELAQIEAALNLAKSALKKDFANPAWWDIGPHDWTPPTKPKMGGIFNFMRKKDEPVKGELIRVDPAQISPAGALIPSGPPAAGTFANPFDLLPPPPAPRGLVTFAPKGLEPMFDLLAPQAPRREAYAPAEQLRPAPPAARPSVPAHRERPAWSLPSPEELASHLRSMLNLPGIFSTLRAARKAPEFRRELGRWGARGLPALIPVSPVATRELYGELAGFFRIPYSVLDGYSRAGDVDPRIWDDLFWPLFDTLSVAFEMEKPEDLPGWFAMEHDPDTDEWWLVYLETQ